MMYLTEVYIVAGIGLGFSLCISIYAYKIICLANKRERNKLNFETDDFEVKDMEALSFVYSDKLEEPAGTTGVKEEMPIKDLTQILELFVAHQEKTKYLEEQIKLHEQKIVRLVKGTKELVKLIHEFEGV